MNWKRLLDALVKQESRGDCNAIGDGGLAVGPLQAHPDVIIDVNNKYGTNFTPEDRTDENKSRAICVLYVLIYAREDRIGHKPTEQDYALCWHYGPNFYKIPDKDNYWTQVLEKINE